ncbi:unnamed protein product [Taenia asiatica]|uniref:SREBP regulating gene protein n=1 Tax=Taenia asiatica TaxID=60517 RepID=A0A0R3W3S7_TAEAS|nr:unnamed protein product [Taenia asiatica]
MRPRDCVVHLGRRFLGITVYFFNLKSLVEISYGSSRFPEPIYNFSWISSATFYSSAFRNLFSLKLGLWRSVLELAQLKAQVDILSATSVFEFCSARCRTSSEVIFLSFMISVVNANAYRDPKRRFCFGVEPPELRLMSSSENATL